MYTHIPLFSLNKYRSVYEHKRLFRKPPLLGPPLSCANSIYNHVSSMLRLSIKPIHSGVHKGGFSKGGFSSSDITITHRLLSPPLLNPPL